MIKSFLPFILLLFLNPIISHSQVQSNTKISASESDIIGHWSSFMGNGRDYFVFNEDGSFESKAPPFRGNWTLESDGSEIQLISPSHDPITVKLKNLQENILSFIQDGHHIMFRRAQAFQIKRREQEMQNGNHFQENLPKRISANDIRKEELSSPRPVIEEPIPNTNEELIMEEMDSPVVSKSKSSSLELTEENISKKWYILKRTDLEGKNALMDRSQSHYKDCYYEFTNDTKFVYACNGITQEGYWFPENNKNIKLVKNTNRFGEQWEILSLSKDKMEMRRERSDYKLVLTTHAHGSDAFNALSNSERVPLKYSNKDIEGNWKLVSRDSKSAEGSFNLIAPSTFETDIAGIYKSGRWQFIADQKTILIGFMDSSPQKYWIIQDLEGNNMTLQYGKIKEIWKLKRLP